MNNKIEQLKKSYVKLSDQYQTYLSAFFFFVGFFFDVLTLGRIDDFFNIITLGCYLVALYFILTSELLDINPPKKIQRVYKHKLAAFHFLLGALLSAFTIFYFKSASLSTSLGFLLFMGICLVLNEVQALKKWATAIRVSLLQISSVSFLTCLSSILLGRVDSISFYLGVLLTFALTVPIVFAAKKMRRDTQHILFNWVVPSFAVCFIFIVLYVFKVLPPIPLSVQDAGIYHKVEKKYPSYLLYQERPSWKFWQAGDQTFKARPGDKVYVFVKIFSPGGHSGHAYLEWQKYERHRWQTSDTIALNLTGGREKGFRGYAYKSHWIEGLWRILIKSSDKREIGRIHFEVVPDPGNDPREFTVIEDR